MPTMYPGLYWQQQNIDGRGGAVSNEQADNLKMQQVLSGVYKNIQVLSDGTVLAKDSKGNIVKAGSMSELFEMAQEAQEAAKEKAKAEDAEEEVVSNRRIGSRFGLGLRGNVLTTSDIYLDDGARLHSKVSGGIGWYLKFRPIRWISIEFINDFSFGKFDNVGTQYDEYFRVPIVVGVRGHFFDYGSLDVYGVAAASCTFVTLDDGNDHVNQERRFPQFGAQLGGGISLIAGGFEIGIDARYTIEEAPDESFFGKVDGGIPIHGFLFSLNMGFGI